MNAMRTFYDDFGLQIPGPTEIKPIFNLIVIKLPLHHLLPLPTLNPFEPHIIIESG